MAGLESDKRLGDRFRVAREARGLTLSEVAEQIRIRSIYLAAIEDENWAAIGAPVYVRGFLRTYARFLGLDPEEAVTDFRSSGAPQSDEAVTGDGPAALPMLARPTSRNLSPVIWVASLIAVILIAYVVYQALSPQRGPQVAAVATSTPAATPVATVASLASASPLVSASPGSVSAPSPGAAGPGSLQVIVAAPSWLRVSVDGSVSMMGTFPAGTNRVFHGKYIQMRVGNAGGITIYLDGKNLGRLGRAGDVVDRAFTL